ncbi:MAG: prolipoprotein diacylglyceryl transferase [Alphaproteobacteria bacterium]
MYSGIPFPDIDPIVFSIGFFSLRWYSLAYLAGFFGGWVMARKIIKRDGFNIKAADFDDFITFCALGVILGGRIGYILFYNLDYFIHNPLEVFKLWHGGMSFHGGFLGFIVATFWFSKSHKIPFFVLTDICACVAPLGLYFGRLANFVNGELFGRVTYNVPWAIIFPYGGNEPRHPSQIYEALLEGMLMLIVLNIVYLSPKVRDRAGVLSGLFLIGYGSIRIFLEQFREPDVQLGFLFDVITMGQLLSIPMLIVGMILLFVCGCCQKDKI